ncbi:YcaO-like family protein [Bradyrhizobium sp. AZCC 1699]|uniref:YcaO-like family protein n=1 Tax=Bradyrhizobium sp. AZCC 1699 TaxID=3117024 RepID=UPI002FF0DE05
MLKQCLPSRSGSELCHLQEALRHDSQHPIFTSLGSSQRRKSLAHTLAVLSPLVEASGISRVADITGLDSVGIPVAMAIRPLGTSLSVSQGSGVTLPAAKIAAIVESLETWYAETLPTADHVATLKSLSEAGYQVLSPDALAKDLIGPLALAPDSKLEWLKSVSIFDESLTLIPRQLMSLNSVNHSVEITALQATSNGLASGNDLAESLSHAIFEILERHTFDCWMRKSFDDRSGDGICLETLDGIPLQFAKKVISAELRLSLFDLSEHTTGGFCFVANIDEEHPDLMPARPYTGRGYHVYASMAAARAISEAAQSRLTMIAGSRDDIKAHDYYAPRQYQTSNEKVLWTNRMAEDIQEWEKRPVSFLKNLLMQNGFNRWLVYPHAIRETGLVVTHSFVPGATAGEL